MSWYSDRLPSHDSTWKDPGVTTGLLYLLKMGFVWFSAAYLGLFLPSRVREPGNLSKAAHLCLHRMARSVWSTCGPYRDANEAQTLSVIFSVKPFIKFYPSPEAQNSPKALFGRVFGPKALCCESLEP